MATFGRIAPCTVILIMLAVRAVSGPELLFFCDGSTDRCVDLRRDSDCVPVTVCFLHYQNYPPWFKWNSGPFYPLSLIQQFKDSSQNRTSANFCVAPEAFENGSVEIWMRTRNSGTFNFSNPVTLHANPELPEFIVKSVKLSRSMGSVKLNTVMQVQEISAAGDCWTYHAYVVNNMGVVLRVLDKPHSPSKDLLIFEVNGTELVNWQSNLCVIIATVGETNQSNSSCVQVVWDKPVSYDWIGWIVAVVAVLVLGCIGTALCWVFGRARKTGNEDPVDDSTLYNTNVSSPTTDAGKPIRPLPINQIQRGADSTEPQSPVAMTQTTGTEQSSSNLAEDHHLHSRTTNEEHKVNTVQAIGPSTGCSWRSDYV